MVIDKKQLEVKKKKLEKVSKELKNHFIGIDRIIDSLINYIQIWYLMPELLNRPVIINLWGMTGVGKTDLVRRIVKALDMMDRFCEIELSNVDETNYESSVASILDNHKLNDEQPAIVLFDEIQRFNTKDEMGNPLSQTKFTDFWELLSDGKLSKKEKEDLDYYIQNYLFNKKDNQRKKLKGETIEDNSLNFWETRNLFEKIGEEVNYDKTMNEEEMLELLIQAKKKKKIYEPVSYSKALIIISGNLDQAYTMSGNISETDIDADIFHAFSKKITDVDIKNALSAKFRPEQVARFGNIHLIYDSLCRKDFENLIKKEIKRIIHSVKEKYHVNLEIDSSINRLIYRNGVFPVQGVRPLFSSINDILESNLSQFLFKCLMNEKQSIHIKFDEIKLKIEAKIGDEISQIPYIGRIDKIREQNVIDNVSNISVHECGHAVVYMVLTGLVPLQLKSKIASSYSAGFTFPHSVYSTKSSLTNKIMIYLAGGLAEELIFGKEHTSTGRSEDRNEATKIAINYIREFGFEERYQASYVLDNEHVMDKYKTDIVIEDMIQHLVKETEFLLMNHKTLLLDLSKSLIEKGSLTSKEMVEIGLKHNVKTQTKEEGFLKIEKYHQMILDSSKNK